MWITRFAKKRANAYLQCLILAGHAEQGPLHASRRSRVVFLLHV